MVILKASLLLTEVHVLFFIGVPVEVDFRLGFPRAFGGPKHNKTVRSEGPSDFGLLPPSNPLLESVFKLDKACSILSTERSGSLYAQVDRVKNGRSEI
jgi:hypothetical protein